jgi:hypothetical protein
MSDSHFSNVSGSVPTAAAESEDQPITTKETKMSNLQFASVNGSVPTAAAESKDQPFTTKETEMSNSQFANVNGSVPTTGPESIDQPINNPSVKLYKVWITADVEETKNRTFSGEVSVYATDEDKAVKKVEAKLKDGTLDVYEMTDCDNDWDTVSYSDVQENVLDQRLDVELSDQDEFDPDEALTSVIEDFEESISWNTEALAKHKAFLESLLNEGGDKQAVRRNSVVKDDVDPAEVIEVEVEDLLASIDWTTEALAKYHACLESLLSDEKVVAT